MQTSNIALADLRIGNYISTDIFSYDKGEHFEISSIPYNRVMVRTNRGIQSVSQDEISGIYLTNEWMYMFGFIKTGYGENDYGHSEVNFITFSSKNLYISTEQGYVEISKEIKYIHELQNAFYWITGTELTLK